jgi:hypothetical protein
MAKLRNGAKPKKSAQKTKALSADDGSLNKMKAAGNAIVGALETAADAISKLNPAPIHGFTGLKPKRVMVPADRHYAIGASDSTIFVIQPGRPWPAKLVEWVDDQAQVKAREIVAKSQQNQCARSYSPDESLQGALSLIRCQSPKVQNTIVAHLLHELGADRQRMEEALKTDLEKLDKQYVEAVQNATGFAKIRGGDFEKLNMI